MSEPKKDSSGDPLFDAALKWAGPRTVTLGERIILTEHQPRDHADAEYLQLMRSSSSEDPSTLRLMPLHSYYGEFRLGHGDPLFKAAMQQWPCTTTEFCEPESNHRKRKLRDGSCTTLVNHLATASMMPFNDIVKLNHLDLEHESIVRERRFVLLDEDGDEQGVSRRVSF
ncbi:hypothetical protein IV203_007962 [Nitzschia inconspicua]|uniref:Uncharacterized protein n=1 Tax=Nitzschia inconspicua TaxID=303405 RepID=A0A9K3PNZ4_9STRA|nr:hypothetical protein IV203_007962 [Nitzschia inconspicua]